MHRFGVPAFVAILFGIFAGCSFAQKAADNQDLTADELAVNASSRYAQGNYAEAAKLYRKFVADFGSRPSDRCAIHWLTHAAQFSVACQFRDEKVVVSRLPWGARQVVVGPQWQCHKLFDLCPPELESALVHRRPIALRFAR